MRTSDFRTINHVNFAHLENYGSSNSTSVLRANLSLEYILTPSGTPVKIYDVPASDDYFGL